MRLAMLILALVLFQAAPAFATSCDSRCDVGEVWTEKEGGTCIPDEPKTS